MGLRNALCERLGIEVPIFGFSHSVDVTVALALAGGFPVYGAARETPERIEADLKEVRARIGARPFGVDVMYPALAADEPDRESAKAKLPAASLAFVESLRVKYAVPDQTRPHFFSHVVRNQKLFREQTEAVLASDVNAIATAVGLPRAVIAAAKARSKVSFALIGSVRHVAPALAAGVEVLVAQGNDAGGHTGPVGTFSLAPQIVQAAGGIPVLAAGGIGHGAQIAAALTMGAQGAWLGTAWLATREYHTPPALLKKILAATSEDTVMTRAHSGKPARVLRSAWIDEWEAPGAPKHLPMPYQHALTGELLAAIEEHQIEPLVYEALGQSCAWFNELTTVRDVMDRLVRETQEAFGTAAAYR